MNIHEKINFRAHAYEGLLREAEKGRQRVRKKLLACDSTFVDSDLVYAHAYFVENLVFWYKEVHNAIFSQAGISKMCIRRTKIRSLFGQS